MVSLQFLCFCFSVLQGVCWLAWKLPELPWEGVGCSGRLLHVNMDGQMPALSTLQLLFQVHATTGCGEQGFPSAQPYLSHTPVS